MINYDGINATQLYDEVLFDYRAYIELYTFQEIIINANERVYVIQDSFVLYIGLINYGTSSFPLYTVVFEELSPNEIFNFSFSGFSRKYPTNKRFYIKYKKFHGIWNEPITQPNPIRVIKFGDSGLVIPSRTEFLMKQVPQLHLRERYDQWEGFLYHFIIYEICDDGKTGYAIYCTQNPQVHKIARQKADDVEYCAMLVYAAIKKVKENNPDYNYDSRDLTANNYQNVICDPNMIDILIRKMEQWRAGGWQNRKGVYANINKECIAEHELKYFWISRYIKTSVIPEQVLYQILEEVYSGAYSNLPRYEYLIPKNKWKSEQLVYEYSKKLFGEKNVVYQYRPFFLKSSKGQMSYDIFICNLNIAIEYQGKQHFEPVDIFGGESHYQDQVQRDKLKLELSKQHEISVVYVNYWEDISEELIDKKVKQALNDRNIRSNKENPAESREE